MRRLAFWVIVSKKLDAIDLILNILNFADTDEGLKSLGMTFDEAMDLTHKINNEVDAMMRSKWA